jgi:hypothetical protein
MVELQQARMTRPKIISCLLVDHHHHHHHPSCTWILSLLLLANTHTAIGRPPSALRCFHLLARANLRWLLLADCAWQLQAYRTSQTVAK